MDPVAAVTTTKADSINASSSCDLTTEVANARATATNVLTSLLETPNQWTNAEAKLNISQETDKYLNDINNNDQSIEFNIESILPQQQTDAKNTFDAQSQALRSQMKNYTDSFVTLNDTMTKQENLIYLLGQNKKIIKHLASTREKLLAELTNKNELIKQIEEDRLNNAASFALEKFKMIAAHKNKIAEIQSNNAKVLEDTNKKLSKVISILQEEN